MSNGRARALLIGLVAVGWGSLAPEVSGDALIVTKAMTASTIAEIDVREGAIRVELEIGERDLPAFRNLLPDGLYERLGFAPEPLAERLRRFPMEDLVFRAGGGPLPGRVLEIAPRPRVRRDELTGEPLAATGEDETVVFAVLEYLLPGRPPVLTVKPPGGDDVGSTATIGFVLYHLDLPANDFRYLAAEETLDLDWDDPWYSRFRNRNLRRQYDAPMNAFLYVEPYEVRTEIIVRPVDLQSWIDLGLEGVDTIRAEDWTRVKDEVAAFLAEHHEVVIDGEIGTPVLDRIHFLHRTLRNSTVIDPPVDLDIHSATLGVIFSFPTVGLPQEASLTWELFNDRIDRVPAAATDEAGPLRFFLVPDDNVLQWKNFLKSPTLPTLVELTPPPGRAARFAGWSAWVFAAAGLALGLFAAARRLAGQTVRKRAVLVCLALLVTAGGLWWGSRSSRLVEDQAAGIVGGLLHNVYRAFDFKAEEKIYDVLDRSVDGDLLTEIYLETRRGLELASQGGARAKVKDLELTSIEATMLSGEQGFKARCVWNVGGAVGHWGHIHQRRNQYDAELEIRPVDGVWKITGLELLAEERIS